MKKALFVTYGGGHVNIVRHVYRRLKKEGFKSKIIALTNSVATLDKENIPYKKISDYISIFEYKDSIIELGEKLSKTYYNENSGLSKSDISVYLGINFHDLKEETGSFKAAHKLLESTGHNIFNPVKSMKKILEFEKPDVVILTCTVRMEKAAGLAANELGIPVIMILGTIGDDDIIPYNCKVCVMNESAKKNILQNNSIDMKDIIITGQPDYEENIKIDEKRKNEIKIKLETDKYARVITYVPQPRQRDNHIIMSELIKIAQKNNENLFIVKLHPNEFIQEYKDYIDVKPDNLLITKDAELPYYLYLSDLVLTKFSMGGLYAVFMDKPLVILNIFNEELFPDYSKYGVAVSVNDISKLDNKIIELLSIDSKANDKLKLARREFRNVENSVENIIKVIEKSIIS